MFSAREQKMETGSVVHIVALAFRCTAELELTLPASKLQLGLPQPQGTYQSITHRGFCVRCGGTCVRCGVTCVRCGGRGGGALVCCVSGGTSVNLNVTTKALALLLPGFHVDTNRHHTVHV